MTDKEVISRQAAEIYELKDKLTEANEVKDHWFNESQHSLRVQQVPSVEEHNFLADLIKAGVKL